LAKIGEQKVVTFFGNLPQVFWASQGNVSQFEKIRKQLTKRD